MKQLRKKSEVITEGTSPYDASHPDETSKYPADYNSRKYASQRSEGMLLPTFDPLL